MCRRRPIAFEPLESRHMLSSGGYSQMHFLGSSLAGAAWVGNNQVQISSAIVHALPISSAAASTRWDWLAQTNWYVPTDNLLAYAVGPDLANPVALADQTLWHMTQSSNGQIAG